MPRLNALSQTSRRSVTLLSRGLPWLLAAAPLVLPLTAFAQTGDFAMFSSTPAPGGGQNYTLPVQTLLLLFPR